MDTVSTRGEKKNVYEISRKRFESSVLGGGGFTQLSDIGLRGEKRWLPDGSMEKGPKNHDSRTKLAATKDAIRDYYFENIRGPSSLMKKD